MTRLYVLILCFGILMLYLLIKRWQIMTRNTAIENSGSLRRRMLNADIQQQSRGRQFVLETRSFLLNYIELFRLRQRKVLIRNLALLVGIMVGVQILNKYVFHQSVFIVSGVSFVLALIIIERVERSVLRSSFQRVFPEALTVINGAISSGSSIIQALSDCGEVMPEPLGEELSRISRRLNLGDSPERVFKSSCRRLPYKEYYFFTVAILVNMKSGAKLREVLLRLGKTVSNAKAMESKKKAMTSEVRMSSKITAIIPFIFLFALQYLSPINFDYVMYNPDGRYILYYFLGSEAVGMMIVMFLMRKI